MKLIILLCLLFSTGDRFEMPKKSLCKASYNAGPCCNGAGTTYWCTSGADYSSCSLAGIAMSCSPYACRTVQVVTCTGGL